MSKFKVGDKIVSDISSATYVILKLDFDHNQYFVETGLGQEMLLPMDYAERHMSLVQEEGPVSNETFPKLPGKYIVWCPQANNPQVIHPYYEDAQEEAKRLALKHSGKEFYVCSLSSMFKAHVEVRQEFV